MFFPLHNFNGGWVAEEDTWAAAPPIGTDLDTTGMGKLLIIKRKKETHGGIVPNIFPNDFDRL